MDNWQRARTEQHIQTIYDEEYGPSTVIEYYKQRTDHEQRVHTEVEVLTNICINVCSNVEWIPMDTLYNNTYD